LIFLGIIFWTQCLVALSLFAQKPGHEIPSKHYYLGQNFLADGNLAGAMEHYRLDLKGGVKIGTASWIDSICYYTMIGECFYLGGDFEPAVDAYNTALNLYLQYPNWLSRVNLTGGVTSAPRPVVPWGPGKRTAPIGVFPLGATITTGDVITKERLQQGGIMKTPTMQPIDPVEILRCVAVCIRRRTEILGPLTKFDPLSDRMRETFSKRAVSPNHWSVTWLDVLLGLALEGTGEKAQALNMLENSLLMSGQYDHNLTATALFELGKIHLQNGELDGALDYFYEASISAFQFGDLLLTEEALRNYAAVQQALGQDDNGIIQVAFDWAKSQRNTLLTVSLCEEMVENMIDARNFKHATSGLNSIEKLMGRGLRHSRFADRWNYLNALLFYAHGKTDDGDAALSKVVEGMKLRSPWVYQIMNLDTISQSGGLTISGSLTVRNAAELYEYLLREPSDVDWAVYPMDSLAIQVVVPPGAYVRWFELQMGRDMKEKAFDIAERIRRERFYATQPYRGRLISLRYLLESPEQNLSDEFNVCRKSILLQYPDYQALARDAAELNRQLHSLPTVPTSDNDREIQKKLLADLAAVSLEQEALLRFIASSRIRIPETFPSVKTIKQIQSGLPEDTAILAFIDMGGSMYGFMIGDTTMDAWKIGNTSSVNGHVAAFLKMIGNIDGNKPVAMKNLITQEWQEAGNEFYNILLGSSDTNADRFNIAFKNLVVVPDSALWYLPFEAICIPYEDERIPLIKHPEIETIRYAATASLGIPGTLGRNTFVETTVVPGTMFPKTTDELQKTVLSQLSQSIPKMEVFQQESLNVPAFVYAARLKRLIVFNEISGTRKEAWSWIPFISGDTPAKNEVVNWILLPWGAPRLIILPGFRSMGESLTKNGGNGDEIFLPVLTMQATGAETILISRWRTGGQSAYNLVQSFLNHYEKMPTASAWKTALLEQMDVPLVTDKEPRLLSPGKSEPAYLTDHPFWWSGYLLIDPGEPLSSEELEKRARTENATEKDDENTDEEELSANPEGENPNPDTDSMGDPEDATSDSTDSGETSEKEQNDPSSSDDISENSDENTDNSGVKPSIKVRSPQPVTDESLQEEDDAAYDFYSDSDEDSGKNTNDP